MFFVLRSIPMFFRFIPRASFVLKKITRGLLFLRCAFAAMSTGVSEIPFASFESVFPVHGAIIIMSSMDFGPIGSASGIVTIGGFPLISSASLRKSFDFPKREFVFAALSEKIVIIFAFVSARCFNSSNTFL